MDETEWLFEIPSSYLIAGENLLEINGLDYAENPVSGNPAVLSIHQQNNTWLPPATEGPDTFHNFDVEIAYGPPTPNFEADIQFPTSQDNVTFTSDSQDGGVQSWLWGFEPDNVSFIQGSETSQNIVVKFVGIPGPVDVSLTETNEQGSVTETKYNYINVVPGTNPPPIPEFTTGTGLTAIATGHSVDFVDLSDNNPTTWFWQFEGGYPVDSDIQNPENIYYSTPGFYDVSLTVSGYTDDPLTLVKEDYIAVYEVLPVLNVDCNTDHNIYTIGETVTFTAMIFGGTTPYNYTINFDGEYICSGFTDDNDIYAEFENGFLSPGNKTISVGVTDAGYPQKTGSCFQYISVGQTGPLHTVDFTWDPPNPLTSVDITFQNLTTGPNTSYLQSYWQWFADPQTGLTPAYPSPVPSSEILWNINALNNPDTHASYSELGNYPVTLTVLDEYG